MVNHEKKKTFYMIFTVKEFFFKSEICLKASQVLPKVAYKKSHNNMNVSIYLNLDYTYDELTVISSLLSY